jgi:hypothetical protein
MILAYRSKLLYFFKMANFQILNMSIETESILYKRVAGFESPKFPPQKY